MYYRTASSEGRREGSEREGRKEGEEIGQRWGRKANDKRVSFVEMIERCKIRDLMGILISISIKIARRRKGRFVWRWTELAQRRIRGRRTTSLSVSSPCSPSSFS